MGNLDNLGVIVVVLLLAGIIVVSFVVDPEEDPTPRKGRQSAEAGAEPAASELAASELAARRGRTLRPRSRTRAARKPVERKEAPWKGARRSDLLAGRPTGTGLLDGGMRRAREADVGTGARTSRHPIVKTDPRPKRSTLAAGPAAGTSPATTASGLRKKPAAPGDARRKAGPKGGGATTPETARTARARSPRVDPGYPRKVVLRENESIWKVAVREYGASRGPAMVPAILRANKVRDARRLRPGQTIFLPAPKGTMAGSRRVRPVSAGSSKPARASGNAPQRTGFLPFEPEPQTYSVRVASDGGRKGADGTRIYVVRPGDSLGVIAQRLLGSASRAREIKELNGLRDENSILVGMRLKLPPAR